MPIETLERHSYFWTGGYPRSVEGLVDEGWDFVITVCDRATGSLSEKLSRLALEHRVRAIGQAGAVEPTAQAT